MRYYFLLCHQERISKMDRDKANKYIFPKDNLVFVASLLTKNMVGEYTVPQNGKIALDGFETKKCEKFLADDSIKKVKAMRSK